MLTVIATSLVDAVQGLLLMVQRRVYVPAPPAGVKVAFAALTELNCASDVEGPETTLQAPVPTAGVLAASRAPALLQMVCAPPAFAVLGIPFTVTVTSSNAAAHGALLTVQRKVYGLPATLRPVMVVVRRLAFVMEAAPPPTWVWAARSRISSRWCKPPSTPCPSAPPPALCASWCAKSPSAWCPAKPARNTAKALRRLAAKPPKPPVPRHRHENTGPLP